jgi:hypothetical protein
MFGVPASPEVPAALVVVLSVVAAPPFPLAVVVVVVVVLASVLLVVAPVPPMVTTPVAPELPGSPLLLLPHAVAPTRISVSVATPDDVSWTRIRQAR